MGIPLCYWSPKFLDSFLKSAITMNLLELPATIISWGGQAAPTALDEIEISIYFISTIHGKVNLWVSVQVTES